MNLIEFKNLPDKITPLNATNLNHNFNELKNGVATIEKNINEKSAITCLLNVMTIPTGIDTLNTISNVFAQKGTNLTREGDVVRVGKGVKYVIANTQTRWTAGVANQIVTIFIRKNNENISQVSMRLMGSYESLMISPILIPVTEGDTISCWIKAQGNGEFRTDGDTRAYLTVTEV